MLDVQSQHIHRRRQRLARRLVGSLTTGLLLLGSSCTTTRSFDAALDAEATQPAIHADYQVDASTIETRGQDDTTDAYRIASPARIQQLSHETEEAAISSERAPAFPALHFEAASTSSTPFEVAPTEPTADDMATEPDIEDWTQHEEFIDNGVAAEFVDNFVPTETFDSQVDQERIGDTYETAFLPAEPRVAITTESSALPNCPYPWAEATEVPVPVYEPDVYPEEYICDGGDRGVRVYHDDFGRQGLETEDTVAEFTDDTGHRYIRPSCRTCIYAPQFAAVRSASLPEINLAFGRLAGTHDHRGTVGLRSHRSPEVEFQNDQPIGFDTRSRASGMDRELRDSSLAQIESVAKHIKLNNAFEHRLFLSRDELDRTQEAYLAQAVQLAATWTRDLNPVIVASDVAGQEVKAEFHVEEYVGIEDRSRKGDLKIIKLVDEPTAQPGDVVTFTIHYENIGDRNLYRINIVDNLTPRLEFLDGTTNSDREGQFHVESNNEGSVILTFELTDPLPGLTGGTLSFQCRVR